MKLETSSGVALIGDVVGSRRAGARADVQRALLAALEITADLVPAVQPPTPTIGDEFQAVYADLAGALRASVVVRLALADGLDARTGLGCGDIEIVGSSDYGLTQDGPAWWAAREAIDEAKRRESGRNPSLRSWVVAEDEVSVVNAYLLARDEILSRFDVRQRRLALGLLRGHSQKDLARTEGISASAVSQSLRRSGARSLLDGLDQVAAR